MSPKDFPQLPSTMANQQYCLKWNNHQSNLLRAFDRLLQSESFTDVTLACEGRSMRAHKVVLSACSSYFETLFEEHPDKSPIIILKDMKFTHVSQLVNFMYRGEINITQDMLSGLLKTAETLKVKGLAEVSGEQAAANHAAVSQQSTVPHFPPIQPGFRLGNQVSPLVTPSSSALTAALNAPVTSPHLPLSALLNPDVVLDERRVQLLKRMSQSQDLEGIESPPKLQRREEPDDESPSHHLPIPHLLNPIGIVGPPKTPTSMPLLFLNHNAQEQHKRQQEVIKQERQDKQLKDDKTQAMPTSPVQPVLTPIPHELTVNAQQELPDFLKGCAVYRLNDYLGFRTRQQFWEEPAVRRIMEAIKNKEIDMKSAAEIVGVSYGTLYGRYREVFGYLKHSWVNKPGRTSTGGSKERSVWEESRAQELIQQVLSKELSLTAAAVRLGVDPSTFFGHLTDNGMNKARVALLTGGTGGEDSNHSGEFEHPNFDPRNDSMLDEDSNDPSEILRGVRQDSDIMELNGRDEESGEIPIDDSDEPSQIEVPPVGIHTVKSEEDEVDVEENVEIEDGMNDQDLHPDDQEDDEDEDDDLVEEEPPMMETSMDDHSMDQPLQEQAEVAAIN